MNLKSMIATAYQAVVPAPLRRRAWEWRTDLATTAGAAVGRREWAAARWVRYGQPLRRVRVPHARLWVDLRDIGVGRKIYVYRRYEEPEAAVLRAALRPGMRHLDIGGNLGYLATLAAHLVGPRGAVVAVEPDPYNFGLLTRNLAENGFAQATPVHAAAGAAAGTARLYRAAENLGDHRLYSAPDAADRPGVDVPVVRLDELYAARGWPHPDVVKIDVQGYEPFALLGLGKLADPGRPMTVLTEYWPVGIRAAGGDPAGYLKWFADRGFTGHLIRDAGEPVPVDVAEVDAHLPPLDPARPDAQMLNLVFRR